MNFRRNSGPGRLRHGTLLAAILVCSCLWAGITGAAEPPEPAPVDAIGPQRLAILDAVRMALAENTVTLFRDGHITVNGPLPNEDLCLRMLADALAAVRQFKRQPQAVTVPRLIVPTDLCGNGKG